MKRFNYKIIFYILARHVRKLKRVKNIFQTLIRGIKINKQNKKQRGVAIIEDSLDR